MFARRGSRRACYPPTRAGRAPPPRGPARSEGACAGLSRNWP